MKKKVLIADTSWLIKVGNGEINPFMELADFNKDLCFLIHTRVIEELERLKKVNGKALQARRVSRFIEEVNKFCLGEPVRVVSIKGESFRDFESALQSDVDAAVLALAERIKEHFSAKSSSIEVILLTTNKEQKAIAEGRGIKTCDNLEDALKDLDSVKDLIENFVIEDDGKEELSLGEKIQKIALISALCGVPAALAGLGISGFITSVFKPLISPSLKSWIEFICMELPMGASAVGSLVFFLSCLFIRIKRGKIKLHDDEIFCPPERKKWLAEIDKYDDYWQIDPAFFQYTR